MRGGVRRFGAVAALWTVATAVSGCSVPVGAVAGISATAGGRPLGVVLVCHHHLDRAQLRTIGETPGSEKTLTQWSRGGPVTGLSVWPLDGSGDGWRADVPPSALDPDRRYHLYGGTEDDSWSARGITFTTDDLASVSPGQVRYAPAPGEHTDGDGYRTASMEWFRREACRGMP